MKGKKMNAKYRLVPTEFGPETRFDVRPLPPAPFRAVQETRFERLKIQLIAQQLAELWEPDLYSQVRRAANEAAALAWVTPYPLLVFPVLFEEKAQTALFVAERQEQVREQTRELLAV
jgi:hypothetical protein